MLPTDYDERKALPLYTFLLEYFPLAFLEVVRVAVDGDKQHQNDGKKIRWAREKSTDQLNTAMRHQFDYGMGARYDVDGRAHLGKAIWRLMAQLQLDEERARGLHCGCTINDVPVRRDACEKHRPVLIDMVRERCTAREGGVTGPRCILGADHPGGHRSPANICGDCGVDLEEQAHAAGCLRLMR